MLMSYVLDAGRFGHALDALAPRYFNHAAVDYNDVIGSGKAKVALRPRRVREGRALCGRGRRHRAAACRRCCRPRMVAEHVTTRLRDAGAAAAAGAGAHGAARHLDRPRRCCRASRANSRSAAPRWRPRCASSPAIRTSIPAARSSSATSCSARCSLPGGTKTKTGAVVDRRARARRARRARPSSCRRRSWNGGRSPSSNRPTPMRCPATSTRRPSACTRIMRWPRRRPGASRRRSRTCRTSRSAPRKAARSAAPSWRRRAQARLGRLFADRAAPARRDRRRAGAAAGLQGRARHPRHDGVGNVRRAGEGDAGRRAPPRQGDQFRHHLRHLGVRAGEPACASRARRPAPTSRSISSASPASAPTWTRRRRSRRRTAMC